ncbi:MAG: methyltransferase domain-containing protein [Pirellulaceae bacterium]
MRKPQFTKVLRLVGAICLSLAGSWLTAQTTTLEVSQPAQLENATQNEEPGRAVDLPSGINDSFLDPEMKVEDFIKRFETESREVFSCRKQILAAVQLEPGMAVADVGAGTGLYMAAFANAVGNDGKVYAIDISPNFVKHLRERAKQEKLGNVEVVLCSDHDVNLKPNSVDRVFICDVYHHFEYPDSSLASIYAALRAGGQLILVDFNNDGAGERGEWLKNHVRAPKNIFKQEVIDAGFKFVEEVNIDGFQENYLLRFVK